MKHWTPNEDEVLRAMYPRTPWDALLATFPGRDRTSIYHRTRTLGIKRLLIEHPPVRRYHPHRIVFDARHTRIRDLFRLIATTDSTAREISADYDKRALVEASLHLYREGYGDAI